MPVRSFFPTRIYAASLTRSRIAALNPRLLRECLQLRHDDAAGQRWSRRSYPGGYTSYASASRMHQLSPSFAQLQRLLDAQVQRFVAELEFDLGEARLSMTDCWVNIMPKGVTHSLHLHPLSVISGTYYVRVPRGAPGLKFEDPRLDRYMGAPPRRPDAAERNKAWVTLPAAAGSLLLFESWLRHEVVANQVATERVSISFNYGWH
ncbi:MAG: TIGR02466 family protein [Steroidobacteraceae bacterium]